MATSQHHLCIASLSLCLCFNASALDWKADIGFRSAGLPVPSAGRAGFTLLSSEATGIRFTNRLAVSRYTTNQIYLNGSGVALGDVDGDGLCDIYFCSLDGPNVLYRNRGHWTFEDVTISAGVACAGLDGTSAALADLDGDTDLDLIVSSIGQGTLVFLNDGQGHFQPSGQAPLNRNRAAMSMALADIDADGDPDLYIANYRLLTIRDQPNTTFRVSTKTGKPMVVAVNGRPVTEPDLVGRFELDPNGKVIEHGEPDALYLNDGTGKFSPVSFTRGAFLDEDGQPLQSPPYDWGLSVAFRDINRDGAPDLYICNDFNSPDRIWINNGKGRFQAIPRLALRTTCLFSMGLDFADLNCDGFDEIYVADMVSRDHAKRHLQLPDILPPVPRAGEIDDRPQYSRNVLLLNRGDATFAEMGQFSRLYASEWSWSPVFLDVDLDGYEDVLIATGNERDSMNADIARDLNARLARQGKMSSQQILDLRKTFPRLELPNLAFRNRGDLTFEETGAAWGFNTVGVSQGMALADLDNDGDLDVVINNLNGPAGVYRNESAAPRLAVRLKGRPPNTRGTGSRISVVGGPAPQSQEMICAGRYLSSDDPMRTFAAGSATNRLSIEVLWRSGRRSRVEDARPNHVYEIDEAPAIAADAPLNPAGTRSTASLTSLGDHRDAVEGVPAGSWFEDVSSVLNHSHHENPYDDFARQALLQRRLSQLGPGIAWYDVDGDGWEDLIIGSGAGGRLSVFRNDGRGSFQAMTDPPLAQPVTRDQSSILGWSKAPGQTVLLAGSANYEDGLAVGPVARQYDLAAERMDDRLPGQASSTGPMAMADLDGDGDVDLFVGGRVIGGRYPEAASSLLFRRQGQRWELDGEASRLLAGIGLVSGALWSDLDQDGFPELILACEAGPIRVFRNRRGKLSQATSELGLEKHLGLWNGVTTADVDGDGDLDIVASNWGWNNRYQSEGAGNLRFYHGDFIGNGRIEVIEACFNQAMGKAVPFPGLQSATRALPFMAERSWTHEAYGMASVEEILGSRAKAARILTVNTLASMVFLNRGDNFQAVPLPDEAQFAPAFGVSAGDMDGDGDEDIFLSQNFFALQQEIPRMDAGRGLWLSNDGHGRFTPVPGQVSGVKVYGEQRGCALADYDRDGRIDLAVTQNGAATKLFRNVGAKPGLRVRLSAGTGNPHGIGATLRISSGGKAGPAREVRAGSGYWSQDGATQVMSASGNPTRIEVRWPGGKSTTSAIPAGAREIFVEMDGTLQAIQ